MAGLQDSTAGPRHAATSQSSVGKVGRDFTFTNEDFRFIRTWIKERAGIDFAENKQQLVYGRLVKRLRALELDSFKDYCDLLSSDVGDAEAGTAINALTTNKTAFFRESHHFEHLTSVVLSEIKRSSGHGAQKRLRIWSAGCSSGEEPYSTAMTLIANLKDRAQWNARILATDLDSNMVKHGRDGIYRQDAVETVPQHLRKRFLKAVAGCDRYRICDDVRSLITFKQLNLLERWPMKGPFDLIFCRNVVIYFDKPTQMRLFDRYADILVDDGFLYIGHSESLFKVTDRFKLVGQSVYQKLK